MNDDPDGALLSLAVEDMIEDARYAANLGGLEGARRMVAAYEGCRGLTPAELESRSTSAPARADRLAAGWCVEVWTGVRQLRGDAGVPRVTPDALHKAAELLGYVAPVVRAWADPV